MTLFGPHMDKRMCVGKTQDWLQKTPKTFAGQQKKKSADQKKRRLDGCIGIEARTREEEKKNAGTDVRQRSAS